MSRDCEMSAILNNEGRGPNGEGRSQMGDGGKGWGGVNRAKGVEALCF